MSRQKEFDADPKATQQVEFVGPLKSNDGINADGTYSMFVLAILQKIKEMRLKFFPRKRDSLIKDGKLSRSKS